MSRIEILSVACVENYKSHFRIKFNLGGILVFQLLKLLDPPSCLYRRLTGMSACRVGRQDMTRVEPQF